MDRTPDDPKDLDLTDPQVSALTTPDLDGDDIEVVENVDATTTPSEPTAHNYQPGPEQNAENTRTDRDPAEGGTEVPAPAEAQPG